MRQGKQCEKVAILREIEALRWQTVATLRVKYREVFRRESRSNHKQFLIRRIAWRLQADAEGDLSERARQRAVALAEEAELRIRAPEAFLKELSSPAGTWQANRRDSRLPAVGHRLTRHFQGQTISVEVLEQGFLYQDRVFKSLSAVARQVTGTQWNGFAFFGLAAGTERTHGC